MVVCFLRRGRLANALICGLARLGLGAAALLPFSAAAQSSSAPLAAVLQSGQAEALQLTWTVGRAGEGADLLRIDGGRATLQRCEPPAVPAVPPGCAAVGAPLTLTAGQRGQLVSVLRAAALPQLRSADPESSVAADRVLELAVGGAAGARPKAIGRWLLARSEWPTPPDGYGVAEYLDEQVQKLRQAARAGQPIALPTTVDELAELRVQLRLFPRTRPGGLLTIEHGLVHVTPAEGSLPRSPPPRPWERPLQKSEEEQLLKALQAAQLDHLDERVPKRAAPAIGDDDGRLATLHLMRAESSKSAALGNQVTPSTPIADARREEPRGVERYLADLMRSTAQPLLGQLVELLLAPPPAAPARPSRKAHALPPPPSHR